MKINLIRYHNVIDPNSTYFKDSNQFIEDINNELFEDDIELVENATDSLFSIVFIETGGSEQVFVKEADKLAHPVILLSHCKNNSLPACFEIKTYLDSQKIDCILLFGDEKECAGQIRKVTELFSNASKIRNSKLGVIGEPSDWLIASKVDYEEVKKKFNTSIYEVITV